MVDSEIDPPGIKLPKTLIRDEKKWEENTLSTTYCDAVKRLTGLPEDSNLEVCKRFEDGIKEAAKKRKWAEHFYQAISEPVRK
jgi:hypothetical protein